MITAAAFLTGGLLLGTLHFGALRWNVVLYGRPRAVAAAALVHVLRFGLLTAVLVAVSFHGPLALLMTVAGLVLARPFVIRWLVAAR